MADVRASIAALTGSTGGEQPPIFAPLVRSVASQIDAVSPLDLVCDPTRLGKGIAELARGGGIDVLVTAAPSAMEAQALGVSVDCSEWPPQVSGPHEADFDLDTDFDAAMAGGEMIAAAIECTARLAQEGNDDKVIVAALTGPSTLAQQLSGSDSPDEPAREFAAAALAALARKFGQAGADVIVAVEDEILVDNWPELYTTMGNDTKFLKKPLVPVVHGSAIGWPKNAIIRDAIVTLPANPTEWRGVDRVDGSRIIVTRGEVPAEVPLETLFPRLDDTRYEMGA